MLNLRKIFDKNIEYYKLLQYACNTGKDGFISPLTELNKILGCKKSKEFALALIKDIIIYASSNKINEAKEDQIIENLCYHFIPSHKNPELITKKLKIFCFRFRDFLYINTIKKIESYIFGIRKYRDPVSDFYMKGMVGLAQIMLKKSITKESMNKVFFNYITDLLTPNERFDFLEILKNKNVILQDLNKYSEAAMRIYNAVDESFPVDFRSADRKGGFELEFHIMRLSGNVGHQTKTKLEIDEEDLELYKTAMSELPIFTRIRDGLYTSEGAGKLILNHCVLDVEKESVSLEYSTPPRTVQELQEFIIEICKFASERDAFTSSDAGLHIHVSIRDYGLPLTLNDTLDIEATINEDAKTKIINLIMQYVKYEDAIMDYYPFIRRGDNNYIITSVLSSQGYHKEMKNPTKGKKKAFCLLYGKLQECKNLNEMIQILGLETRVLTLAIRPEFGTMEFRGLPGIINLIFISAYTKFCFDIVHSCQQGKRYNFVAHPSFATIKDYLCRLSEDGLSEELHKKSAIYPQISFPFSNSYNIKFLIKHLLEDEISCQNFRQYIRSVNSYKSDSDIPTFVAGKSRVDCGKTTMEKMMLDVFLLFK